MNKIEQVLQQHTDRLMQLPNVVAVGIGKRKGRKVIKVMVSQKVDPTRLQPHQLIPRTLDGFEVDVEEIGEIRPQN